MVSSRIADQATARSLRSRPRTAPSAPEYRGSADDTALRHVQLGEVCVRVGERQRHRYGRLAARFAHLGNAVLEPLGQVDAGAVLLAGDGIEDRGAFRLSKAFDAETPTTALDVN